MKILIAEDEPVSRLIVGKTLRSLGHTVVDAKDGREAQAALEADHYDVLVTDWMMPEMDGVEVTRLVRAMRDPRYTYVILLTTLSGKGDYLEGMEAGADDFLTKPFDVDQLKARLRVAERVLALQEQVQQLSGLLPMCAYCRRIRDEESRWQSLETYVAERTAASFSHGICASCMETRVKPDIERMKAARAAGGKR